MIIHQYQAKPNAITKIKIILIFLTESQKCHLPKRKDKAPFINQPLLDDSTPPSLNAFLSQNTFAIRLMATNAM